MEGHVLAQQSSSAQERIGRYEVLRKIATGGMAELFLAKMVGMEGFEKVVAIKRILAHLAYDDEFINMFRDEARIVAKLSHPNIVQIYDLAKSQDTYFIAMEYIPGRNLSSIAKKARALEEKLPPKYIARCIAQACEGLYYAHTRKDIDGRPLQIVHRDVSPQNIIVSFSGTVKLVDFGIAKAATKIAHTRAGVLKGKYAYMSPEQIRGEDTDARSDLFAAGIVLYELLCGRRPFEKENSIQTLKAIVQDQHVDCREHNADIPDELAGIIDHALTKDPADRYQNAQELQIALEDFVTGDGERVNNITIADWVTRLFEEELSRERGGTVVFQGVGEVILPDVVPGQEPDDDDDDDLLVDEDVQSASGVFDEPSEELVPLSRGRGGGSVDPRPPIPAPSNSMLNEIDLRGGERHELLEEQVIDGFDDDGGWDDDATVHGIDMASSSPEPTQNGYTDDKTEFAPPNLSPDEARRIAAGSESATLTPGELESMRRRPLVSAEDRDLLADVGESLLGPLADGGGDDAFLEDDPWDEATVGYPEGTSPHDFHDSTGEPVVYDESVSRAREDSSGLESVSGLFETEAVDEFSDDFIAGDATIAGAPGVWDDETASRDVYQGPNSSFAPIASTIDGDSDNLDLEMMDPDAIQDLSESMNEEDYRNDSTIAVPSISDEMLERATEDSAEFDAGATLSAADFDRIQAVRSSIDDELLPQLPERDDSGGWLGDATIAGGPSIDELLAQEEDDDLIGHDSMPDIGPEGAETVRAMDEEPELPVPFVDHGEERDARTVAGVTSDYMSAGIEPPVDGGYDPDDTSEFADAAPGPSMGTPKKRGQEALGAIRLNKVSLGKSDKEITRRGDDATTVGIDGGDFYEPLREDEAPAAVAKADSSLPELDEVDFEFAMEDTGDDVPAVQPRPLDDGDEPPNFSSVSVAGEEYSKLVSPAVPKPLVPVNVPQVGSTNVPPSNLSLSQVLEAPADKPMGGQRQAPARSISISGRSASLIGRQIREVVRTDEPQPASPSALQFTPQDLDVNDTVEPSNGVMPPIAVPEGPPLEIQLPAAISPAAKASKRRALIVALVALAVVLLSAVAVVAIPLLFPHEPTLEIRSTPPGAKVFVDGTEQPGKTPLTMRGLEPGVTYDIRIDLEGYQQMSRPVQLQKRSLMWQIPLKRL